MLIGRVTEDEVTAVGGVEAGEGGVDPAGSAVRAVGVDDGYFVKAVGDALGGSALEAGEVVAFSLGMEVDFLGRGCEVEIFLWSGGGVHFGKEPEADGIGCVIGGIAEADPGVVETLKLS